MTTFDRIEPRLPELIDELGAARVPDYFDDLLRATAAAKQRPAWSSLERWLPMGEIARPLPFRPVPWRPIVTFALVALLVAAGLVAYSGSRPRLPAPFGAARDGSIFYAADGALYAADPVTGTTQVVLTGSTAYDGPLLSRDGQRILYEHTQNGTTQLFVADTDGSDAHALPGDHDGYTWAEWSPDSSQVGIVSMVDGRQAITVLDADGSAANTLPLGHEVMTFWWLPDGGIVFTGSESPTDRCFIDGPANTCALFVASADGSDVRKIQTADQFAGLSTSVSPDGGTVLVDRWNSTEPGRLHLVQIANGADHRVPMDNLDAGENSNIAEFSPDGSLILFDRYEANGEDHWSVVPTAGGSAVNIGIEWPDRRDGIGPEAHWSPDGKSVIAFYPGPTAADDQLLLLDPTGKAPDQHLDLPVSYAPAWQRLAP